MSPPDGIAKRRSHAGDLLLQLRGFPTKEVALPADPNDVVVFVVHSPGAAGRVERHRRTLIRCSH